MSPRIELLSKKASEWSYVSVLIGAGILVIWVNWPGHLSFDSVVQIHEGYSGVYQSSHPPFLSKLWGTLYRITQNTGIIVAINVGLYMTAMALFLGSAPASARWRTISALGLSFYPVVVVYNGLVWKDVVFANLAFLSFSLLLVWQREQRFRWLVLASLACSFAVQTRQQGLILIPVVALCAWWVCADGTSIRILAGLTPFVVYAFGAALVSLWISSTAISTGRSSYDVGLHVIKRYDLAGIATYSPNAQFEHLLATGNVSATELRGFFRNYSSERIDTLDVSNGTNPYAKVGEDAIDEQWSASVREYPFSYLAHRISVYSWTLGLRDPTRCLPFHVGISSEPSDTVRALGLSPGVGPLAQALFNFNNRLVGVLYRPILYVVGAFTVLLFLIRRGFKEHAVIGAMLTASLLYSATYLVASIACDFRYHYFVALVALVGASYAGGICRRTNGSTHPPAKS